MKCDELKPLVFSIVDLAYVDEIRVNKNFQNPHDHAVYKATEVDAAIAELKRENERLVKCCKEYDSRQRIDERIKFNGAQQLRHYKYKRCLANAEACMHKRWRTDDGFDYARSHRHMNKWLAIAEKFKEAK